MKAVFLFLLMLAIAGCNNVQDEKVELTEHMNKVSYTIGVSIGKNLKRDDIQLEYAAFMKGMKDAVAGGEMMMTEQEMQATMTTFQQEMIAKQNLKRSETGEKNKKAGESFLSDNKKKDGVVTLASGLQYQVLTKGNGPKPKADQSVTTHYKGMLIDGTVFDSSIDRGEPATFPVHGVIPGWTEALQLMPVGSKWKLFVPSNLGYGENGAGELIGPNSTLIFEIELLAIK